MKQSRYLNFAFALCVAAITFTFSSFALAANENGIRPIKPYSSFEDDEIEDFMRSIVLTYLFYGEFSTENNNAANFIFLSGADYLVGGAVNLDKVKRFLPEMTQEEADFFKGKSDVCLVFILPFKDWPITVGVNNTSNSTRDQNYRCVLDAISLFFYGEFYKKLERFPLTPAHILRQRSSFLPLRA